MHQLPSLPNPFNECVLAHLLVHFQFMESLSQVSISVQQLADDELEIELILIHGQSYSSSMLETIDREPVHLLSFLPFTLSRELPEREMNGRANER